MEPIPAYLAPTLLDDRATPAYYATQARAARLAALPEDRALRLVQLALQTRRENPRDLNAVGWLLLHPEHQAPGGQR